MLCFHVENVWTYFTGASAYAEKLIDTSTSYKVHGRWFSKSYRRGDWSGVKMFREFNKARGMARLPTGLLSRATFDLDRAGYPYQLLDERDIEIPDAVLKLYDKTLRDYQQEAVETALAHGRGTLKMATGSGKSMCGASIIASYDKPALWLTHRRVLLHQTRGWLQEYFYEDIGIIGDGLIDVQRINVAMIQTLNSKMKDARIKKVLSEAEVVVADEVHHLESKTWYGVFRKLEAPYRFGLTATPCTDGAGLHLVAMTGDVIVNVPTGDLIARGILAKPNIWFLRAGGPKIPKSSPYPTVYSKGIVNNEERNAKLARVAQTFAEEGKPTITLVRQIVHGNLLADTFTQAGVRTEFLHGKHKEAERHEMLDRLWTGQLPHLVAQSEILGEGVDMPNLGALINATGTRGGGSKSSGVEHEVGRGTIQYLGRLLRRAEGKDEVDFVDVLDTAHKSLLGASKERYATLEGEGYGPHIRYWSDREAMARASVTSQVD